VPDIPDAQTYVRALDTISIAKAGPYGFIKTHSHLQTSAILAPLNCGPAASAYRFRADLVPQSTIDAVIAQLHAYHRRMPIPPTLDRPGLETSVLEASRIEFDGLGKDRQLLTDAVSAVRNHFQDIPKLLADTTANETAPMQHVYAARIILRAARVLPELVPELAPKIVDRRASEALEKLASVPKRAPTRTR
jgi:hypothetical protein